ncbi:MAG: hypothetical protein ABSH51_20570 [Solirubrobacteraceae bacterium]
MDHAAHRDGLGPGSGQRGDRRGGAVGLLGGDRAERDREVRGVTGGEARSVPRTAPPAVTGRNPWVSQASPGIAGPRSGAKLSTRSKRTPSCPVWAVTARSASATERASIIRIPASARIVATPALTGSPNVAGGGPSAITATCRSVACRRAVSPTSSASS